MGTSAEHEPNRRPSSGRVSVDELAWRNGVQPIRSADDLACDGIVETDEELDEFLAHLANAVGSSGAGRIAAARGRTAVAALPANREKSDRPAPVYQLKVSLRGTTPPIWRRLEVPADVSLARLHTVIQAAFGWTDSRIHVFAIPYGSFGVADAELGQRAEAPVTLEQVAPTANSRLCYTYDFGDNWEHDIVVEKVLDRKAAAEHPRCTVGPGWQPHRTTAAACGLRRACGNPQRSTPP